uniref:Mitochondrial import receptor subunit TOM7 homolog n=1 Tax=Paramormyrops kingsleyae TaxID=1676925 RepID=A0A3B3QKY5_9TELE
MCFVLLPSDGAPFRKSSSRVTSSTCDFFFPVLVRSVEKDPIHSSKTMAKLSKETKQRLQQVFQCGQFIIRWGFIPTVLYLGFKRGSDPGMPEPTVLRYCVHAPFVCGGGGGGSMSAYPLGLERRRV